MAPRFPLPPVGEEQEAAMMAELAHRQQLSGALCAAVAPAGGCCGWCMLFTACTIQTFHMKCLDGCQVVATAKQGRQGATTGAAASGIPRLLRLTAAMPVPCPCPCPAAPAAEALPSCAFFTFFNTHQSLTCATFTSDAAVVAGAAATAGNGYWAPGGAAAGAATSFLSPSFCVHTAGGGCFAAAC